MPAIVAALIGIIGFSVGLPAPLAHADVPNSYSIATYNSQGARWADVRAISDENDIVAVQEAGPEPTPYGMNFLNTYVRGGYTVRAYQWGTRYVYWMSPTGDSRVNLAMVTRTQAHEVFVAPPGRAGARPALGLRFDNDIYYSLHAAATGASNEAEQLVANIATQARAAGGYAWTAIGDFNRDPNQGMHTAARAQNAWVYHSGESTQQSGGELDYMISSRDMANYRGVRNGGRSSDHYPIYFRTQLAANGSVVDLISDSDHAKFIGFEARSSANGTRVITDSYDAQGSLWTLRRPPGGGQFEFNLVNNGSGKCIDVYGGPDAKSGNYLNEWDCLGQASQVFSLHYWDEEPGTWEIVQKSTGLCVDTMGTQPKYLALYACTENSPNQHFMPHYF